MELLEWTGEDAGAAFGSIAIGFGFVGAWLTIFNAEDENGLSFGRPDARYLHRPLAP